MVAWKGDGGLACFYAPIGKPTDISANQVSYLLATNAMVDVEGVTRLHYALNSTKWLFGITDPINDRVDAQVVFTYTDADIAARPTGWRYTATMFIAKASEFADGHVPTPDEMLAVGSNLIVKRASDSTITAGDFTFYITGPRAGTATDRLNPNTKYWFMVAATRVESMGSTPSVTNDVIDTAVFPMTRCRGLSMWTNRPPDAPVITSPADGMTAPAGSVLSLALSTHDPDRIVGKQSTPYTDIAGVQVQFRAQPTDAVPDPVWAEMPVEHPDLPGTVFEDWYLEGAPLGPSLPGGGAYPLMVGTGAKSQPLDCATTTPSEYGAQLASGAWQLRARVFDYGNPYPGLMAAWSADVDPTDNKAHITPADAPAANTSPWSEPVNITVSEQVPAPTPLSPINGVAVPEGAPVTLSWLYWNTYVPPFAQAERTVDIRKVGETAWTTLTSGAGTSPTYTIDTGLYPLVATTGYEWSVTVVDADGVPSARSPVATFWVVPAPISGPLRPVPTETVDGATLGEGKHRAVIYRRGGKERVGELPNVSYLDWNRVRDDISDAKVIVSSWTPDVADMLRELQCWAYELVIFRENGFSTERVWEGPITLLTYMKDSVTINAKDVMAYSYRRIIKQAMSDFGSSPTAGDTVVSRATRILQNVLAPDDPNVLAYLTPLIRTDDPRQYRSLPPYSKTAFEEIDDMAANSGLDYTCAGRSILLWATKHRIGTLPEFGDNDLGAVPIVSEYGMSMADRYVVSDGNGIWGEATRGLDPVSGNEPTYGLVEMLSSTWANDSSEEAGSYTEEGIETIRASFAEYAERSIADRYPPPVIVRVPDNTTLNPDTVLSIQQLIPGVVLPLRSSGTLRSVVDTQKLDKVQVVESGGVETISITLSPYNRDDITVEE